MFGEVIRLWENGALLGKVTEVSGRVDQIANLDLVATYNQAKA